MEAAEERRNSVSLCVRAALALALEQSLTWLLNVSLFFRYDLLFPAARDVSMVILALVGLGLTVLASRRPAPFASKAAPPLFLGCFLAGMGLSVLAVGCESMPLAVVGSTLRAAGLIWPFVLIGFALAELRGVRALLAVCWGSSASTPAWR